MSLSVLLQFLPKRPLLNPALPSGAWLSKDGRSVRFWAGDKNRLSTFFPNITIRRYGARSRGLTGRITYFWIGLPPEEDWACPVPSECLARPFGFLCVRFAPALLIKFLSV